MDFYLRLLRPPAAPKAAAACSSGAGAGAKSASSKNRRLAKLQRLVEAGAYFSDEAMRARAPLPHFHYVAQASIAETTNLQTAYISQSFSWSPT